MSLLGEGCSQSVDIRKFYQVHPQLQRTESHNRSFCKSALQTAHDLIHMLVSPASYVPRYCYRRPLELALGWPT
jgi:hypothetical protein